MGSLYALLAADGNATDANNPEGGTHHCDCPHHPSPDSQSIKTPPQAHPEDALPTGDPESDDNGGRPRARRLTYESSTGPSPTRQATRSGPYDHTGAAARRGTFGTVHSTSSSSGDVGSRRRVARAFELIGDKLGTPAPDAFDDSGFTTGRAADFPTVPAEELRNAELSSIMASYNPPRDSDGNVTTPLRSTPRSRAESVSGSPVDTAAAAGPSGSGSRLSMEGPAATRVRRDTLEVPTPAYLQSAVVPRRSSSSRESSSFGSASGSPGLEERDREPTSPAIRISHESSP